MDHLITSDYSSGNLIWLFGHKVTAKGYYHTLADYWQIDKDVSIDDVSLRGGFPVGSMRSENEGTNNHTIYQREREGGTPCIVFFSMAKRDSTLYVTVATQNHNDLAPILAEIKQDHPEVRITQPDITRMDFWMLGNDGPVSLRRQIVVPSWDEVRGNYSEGVREELNFLYDIESGEQLRDRRDGQLLLWLGPPGTGKTYALRALAREWKTWCNFHYITDPENFFGQGSQYMMNVLLSNVSPQWSAPSNDDDDLEDVRPKERWNLLILEDCGEMLAADARREVGQGLSRLLNVVDGLIGQGLKLFILVTTNEEIGKLHPAVRRHGRCAQELSFTPLTEDEATAWLEARDVRVTDRSAKTLADLYAELAGIHTDGRSPVGFA